MDNFFFHFHCYTALAFYSETVMNQSIVYRILLFQMTFRICFQKLAIMWWKIVCIHKFGYNFIQFCNIYVNKIVAFCLQAEEHILVYSWSLSPDFYLIFSKSSHHFFS